MIFEVRNMYEPYILKNYGSLLPVDGFMDFTIFSSTPIPTANALKTTTIFMNWILISI